MKLGLISLGCAKNKVDSELFLGVAQKYHCELTSSMDEADIIVVNTCAFIESAKKEALDTIMEALDYQKKGKKIVVMGCLAQRYLEDLKKELPEVDYYLPVKNYNEIDKMFQELLKTKESYCFDYTNRILTTSKSSAYLRIAEGCNNRCSYCAIPLIRGSFVSRPFDEIMEEAFVLAKQGIKEITLIAQDTTRYGTDFKEDPRRLQDLLREIGKIDSLQWIRVLYLYPDEITPEILEEFRVNKKVVKYFDIPIQHASNRMLSLMNRRGSKELIRTHVQTIRRLIPDAILRTTLITGFPTETMQDYLEVKNFLSEMKFDRVGIFTYSREEDTLAYDMTPVVNPRTAENRKNALLELQKKISFEKNQKLIGKTRLAIIEGYDENNLAYVGRDESFAPDDVDGKIYIYSDHPLEIGDFVNIQIVNADSYDLTAKAI